MLLPQSGPSSALAAGPSSQKDPPEVHCLDVSGSYNEGGSTGPADSPPGTEVDLRFHFDTMNNCSDTVTGIIHGGIAKTICNGAGVAPPINLRFPLSDNLASEQHDGDNYTAIAKCVVSVNNVPTRSVIPVSVSVVVEATGTTASGQLVTSAPKTLTLTWT
jgi:hypothetical protein